MVCPCPGADPDRRIVAAKPRVHEIAAELGVDSKIALEKLKQMGEYVKGPSSSIEPPVARRLKAALEADGVAAAAAKNAVPATAAATKPAASAAKPGARPGPKPAAKPAEAAPAEAASAEAAAPVSDAPAPLTVAERQAQAEE